MDQRTQKSILQIGGQKTLQLIDLYEKEECLWNTTLVENRMQTKRKEASERIAKALDIKNFTYRHVIKKFKNMRVVYNQELRKIAKSINSGEDPIYRPKVFWFSKMDGFLRPYVQATTAFAMFLMFQIKKFFFLSFIVQQFDTEASSVRQEENKSPQKIKEEDENSFSFEEHDVEYELRKKRSKNESPIYTRRESVLDDNIDSYSSNHLEVSQPLGLALNEDDPFDNHDSRPDVSNNSKYLEEIVKCLSNLTKNNTQPDDCFDSFGRYVAAMLRSMSKRRALEVQPEIVKLLVSGNMNSGEG
ncbi:uncharacterized protein LOC123660553 [Melitaea cinxia]|uniref:uncharacterized protein LOC123660553 n=1 Tax=Melitaea cinxia TaxID=113334 RepID=UPI001E26F91E|nr:uncharacterized protein LOC123660553 [Melitaea cinxia]